MIKNKNAFDYLYDVVIFKITVFLVDLEAKFLDNNDMAFISGMVFIFHIDNCSSSKHMHCHFPGWNYRYVLFFYLSLQTFKRSRIRKVIRQVRLPFK